MSNSTLLTDLLLSLSLAGFEDANCHVVRNPIRIVWQGTIRAPGAVVISATASNMVELSVFQSQEVKFVIFLSELGK